MPQQWLTVLGLAIDFAGFCLLLREWWVAFLNENQQLVMEEQLERMRQMRSFARSSLPAGEQHNPYASLERLQDETAIRKARTAHRAALAVRRVVFLTAAGLIVAGFALQLAGAWPGCCQALGITPQP